MLDYIEIASALIITLSMLLLLFGVLWTPFAALITARVASARDMASGRMAEAGAKWSLPFFFPWIYLLLRILGKRISDRIVTGAYIVLHLVCLLGPILFNILLAYAIYDIHNNYPQTDGYATLIKRTPSFLEGLLFNWQNEFTSGAFRSFQAVVLWIVMLLASAAVFSYLWARSLNRISASYSGAESDSDHAEPGGYDALSERYLAPLRSVSRILRYWLLSLIVFKIVIEGCILCGVIP